MMTAIVDGCVVCGLVVVGKKRETMHLRFRRMKVGVVEAYAVGQGYTQVETFAASVVQPTALAMFPLRSTAALICLELLRQV